MSLKEVEEALAKDGIKLSCKQKLDLALEEAGQWKQCHEMGKLFEKVQESRIAELEPQLQVAREALVKIRDANDARSMQEVAVIALAKIGSK
jgi:hypothetical protein